MATTAMIAARAGTLRSDCLPASRNASRHASGTDRPIRPIAHTRAGALAARSTTKASAGSGP